MRNEEELQVSPLLAEPTVVKRSHNCLSCSGRRDYKVAIPAVPLAFCVELLKDSTLMRAGLDVDEGEVDLPVRAGRLR